MSVLKEWIRREARVLGPEFLQVDGFLNHRIAPRFIEEAGTALAPSFRTVGVTHVLTAEAAGNVIAYETARRLGAKALYAKKGKAQTMRRPLTRAVLSPTKGMVTDLAVSADYLGSGDRVLIVDDFLYEGETSRALAEIAGEAGARLVGFGFVISKEFASGRARLESFAVPIVALIPVASMNAETGAIAFANEPETQAD